MMQQNEQNEQVPKQKIIHIIEEFLACLNYKNTYATLKKEKALLNGEMGGEDEGNLVDQGKMDEEVVGKEEQDIKQLNKCSNEMSVNKGWHLEQAKYLSKFASFSQIITALQKKTTYGEQGEAKLVQKELQITNNQILEQKINEKPILLHLFSTFDTSSRVKQFHLPVSRNLTIQPKFGKKIKLLSACPTRESLLVVVDEISNVILYDLSERSMCDSLKMESGQTFTSVCWLKSGTCIALSTQSGKLQLYTITKPANHLQRLTTLTGHKSEITSIYCNREYLYTSGMDYTVSKIYIKYWKIQRIIRLKYNWLNKIVKLENRQLGNYLFAIDVDSKDVVMVEETTGCCSVVFSIARQHVDETKKLFDRKDQKISKTQITKYCHISDILVNPETQTLLIAISGINPSLYEYDPITSDYTVRLTYKSLKLPIYSSAVLQQQTSTHANIKNSSFFATLSHKSEVLAVSNNTNVIFYFRLKNWRLLFEVVEDRGVGLAWLTSTARMLQTEQTVFQDLKWMMDKSVNHNQKAQPIVSQKLPVVCAYNNHNGNIQVYYNNKEQLRVIRSESSRPRPFLAPSMGFPSTAQGFLELLQTIRQNYQAFV